MDTGKTFLLASVIIVLVYSGIYADVTPEIISWDSAKTSGNMLEFNALFRDEDGATNLKYIQIKIASRIDSSVFILIRYRLDNNNIYLRNDDNTDWIGRRLNSASPIENKYATVIPKNLNAYSQGKDFIIGGKIKIDRSFGARKAVYLYAIDRNNNIADFELRGQFDASLTQSMEIPGAAFRPANGAQVDYVAASTLHTTTNADQVFYYPIVLPKGSLIRNIGLRFIDNSSSYITLSLMRVSPHNNVSYPIYLHTSGSASSWRSIATSSDSEFEVDGLNNFLLKLTIRERYTTQKVLSAEIFYTLVNFE